MTALRGPEQDFNRQSAAELQSSTIPASYEGSGIALALGGGFSRGFAHLGVLEVLEQEHIPVSAIVGTSIGALLGAAYADGISLRDLCDLGTASPRPRLSSLSSIGEGRAEEGLHRPVCTRMVSRQAVEQLRIPTAIVATDLDTGAPYVFTSGPLEVAIRASCAFPGLVKPVEYEGRLLADGCIVAPVPTAIAARINGGCVLGVSVRFQHRESSSSENVVKVLDPAFRTSHRNALEPSWSRHADILLEPLVHHIDWNDFSRVDEAFAAGAEAMRLRPARPARIASPACPFGAGPGIVLPCGKRFGVMRTSLLMRTLIVMLALEWELGSQDPFVFCYRIGVEPARVFLGRFGKRR